MNRSVLGVCPSPRLGAYSALPDPLAGRERARCPSPKLTPSSALRSSQARPLFSFLSIAYGARTVTHHLRNYKCCNQGINTCQEQRRFPPPPRLPSSSLLSFPTHSCPFPTFPPPNLAGCTKETHHPCVVITYLFCKPYYNHHMKPLTMACQCQ